MNDAIAVADAVAHCPTTTATTTASFMGQEHGTSTLGDGTTVPVQLVSSDRDLAQRRVQDDLISSAVDQRFRVR
jgi:hypothetical protein